MERGEVEVTEEDERKFERKLRRRSSTRFHPDFSLESALLDNDRDEEDKRLSRKGRRASGRYETDVLQILQENEEDDERRKLERKERRVSARFNPDTINEKLLHENEKDDEERKFERKVRRRSSTRFHPDVIKLSSENDKKNEVDSDLKKKWKNNREQVMKNLQIFMQGMDDTENEYQEDVRDDMSQSEADSIPPARVLMNKKVPVPVPVPVRVQGDRCTDKVQVPLSKIKKELEGTGTGSDATGGKETDNSREKMMLEKEREKERLAAEKERQKIMHERERERVMIQERERQRIMSEKEKERIRIGQDRERERALIERERIMQEKEKAFQQKEKNFNSPKEEDSMLRVPRNLKIDTGYSSMTSGSDRDIGGSKGKGIGGGGGGGVGNQNDMYGRARPAVVPSANASPSANQNRPRPKGSFSENVSKNHSRHGSFMEGAGGGSAGGFYAGLPVTSPIVMVDGPFFLSADPPTTSYATHRPLGGSFMSNSLRSTPTSKGNRCTQSFVSTGSRNQSHNNSLGNIIEREAARRQSSHKLDDDKGVDLNLSYDNIYSKDQDDDSSDSDVVSGTNFNSPKNRPDSAKNNSSKLNINNSNNIKNNQKETRVGNRSVEKKKENFRHVDEFYTEGEVPTKSRDEINNNNNDDNSVSTVSHSKYGDNENASMSESDVTTFSAPNYKFPPKKYNFKKK